MDLYHPTVSVLASLLHRFAHPLMPCIAAARALVQAKGLYISNQPVEDHMTTVRPEDVIDERVVVLRAGKGKHLVLVAV